MGGVRNTRKTLPLVDVWFDFKCETNVPKHLHIPDNVIVHPIPFDDGNLKEAVIVWEKRFKQILMYKKDNKKIFISCYEGVSRSAVLALWLCCEEFGNYDEAYQHVKKCRNVYPHKEFLPFLDKLKSRYK